MTKKEKMHLPLIMLMVDGLGIPSDGWHNSVLRDYCCPAFLDLLSDNSVPVDVSMGIAGIPQSATGQTALFTGFNAAREIGMHIQGFPGPQLRRLIRKRNLFSTIIERGLSPVFANAYVRFDMEELRKRRWRSVTTVMLAESGAGVKDRNDLLLNHAIYHDITRHTISLEEGIPLRSPEAAAADLLSLACDHDLVLFEYFLSDRAGHSRDPEQMSTALGNLSQFVVELNLLRNSQAFILLLTSDHGNCEDISTVRHSLNPVPLLMLGHPLPTYSMKIEGIYDYILDGLMSSQQCPAAYRAG